MVYLASFHFQPTYTLLEVSCFYAVYLQILFYLPHQLCLLNGVFRPFTFKVIIIDMLGLNTAILLSFCFLFCFKPYCVLYEHFFRKPSFLFIALLKELFFIGLFVFFLVVVLGTFCHPLESIVSMCCDFSRRVDTLLPFSVPSPAPLLKYSCLKYFLQIH